MEAHSAHRRVPTVSRVLEDGRIVELLYDPAKGETALAVGAPDGSVAVTSELILPSGEQLVPYSARNNLIATRCVLLAGRVGDDGEKADLLAEVRAYLHRYVDLSPLFEEIAAHYALLTWVYDAFRELPYLRFQGEYGTGKTRALMTLGSVCYKPFFASGASTVSPIFHILDVFQGTLVLDEADFRFSDATAGLTKILNNGTVAGMPVLRTMTNRQKEFDPRAFRVFGPKLVGMREQFNDAALESRFLTEETGVRPLRQDVPLQLPGKLADEAQALRDKLLAWRFRASRTVGADASRAAPGVAPRLNQTALALLSIIDDASVRAEVHAELQREHVRLRQDRAATPAGTMAAVLALLFQQDDARAVTVARVADAFNRANSDKLRVPVSHKWVGWFLRTRLKLTTVKSQGVFVLANTEGPKVMALAARYGVDREIDAQAA
ncbi:MAG: hypothetical protein ACHP84_00815 [Caulobacterales bacterium]